MNDDMKTIEEHSGLSEDALIFVYRVATAGLAAGLTDADITALLNQLGEEQDKLERGVWTADLPAHRRIEKLLREAAAKA